ncbi:MAG: hypothetical protein M9932_14465 [Xanthobacteraceae bacterium]|nr:hypothetical protein [Xanthobacteraceae bacterium]
MTLPDKLDGYALLFVLAFLGSTWIAVLLGRLFLAPARINRRLKVEIERLSRLTGAASELSHETAVQNIADIQFGPSGGEMVLVITPKRGGVAVGLFVDIAHHRSGGNLDAWGWPKPERLYLGEIQLRAAGHRFSVAIMDRDHESATPAELRGWLWKIVDPNGKPSGTRPCSVRGKERVTFVFIDASGAEQKFPMLLLYAADNPATPPIVVMPHDLA